MKALKLVFHEKKTIERDDGPAVSMDFKGHWDNNSNEPEITFRITKCNEESATLILADLGIENPGEYIFLAQGINPQIRLDQFFAKAEKRRTSQIANFEVEIADFDENMISERYDKITYILDEMIVAQETETKRFNFYFDCFGVIYEKRVGSPNITTKEEYIQNHTIETGIGGSEDPIEDNNLDVNEPWPDDDTFEEE